MIEVKTLIRLDENSRIPKYQQIVNSIIEDIESCQLLVGDKIPSINEISEEHYLSRDTVEKAYNQLKEKKIILSVKGKGYYVAKNISTSKVRVLFLLNKLSNYKLKTYNSFIDSMGADAQVDLTIYHCDPKLLINILNENLGAYDYYVLMPHFKDEKHAHYNLDAEVMNCLKKLPADKVVIMDNQVPQLGEKVAAIYQDFKNDIYNALCEGIFQLQHYEKLMLVYPRDTVYPYPKEILKGFKKFCQDFDFDFEILETVYSDMELRAKDAYIVIEENDLVNLVKQVREQNYELGKEIGIISYNDTPLKELLGITVVSTDFRLMGETAAYMIKKNKKESVKNVFKFINRGSV
ncbi:substrate-binding protein-like domain-containing protein [Cyclobacterium xiamenense]|uniref:Substrate-binding protein-like domain-containing protein n=1 Tax=Cyclobacterium xiamenense TaxID=1297121 RepID=A0A1H6WM63_9BACT|nr:GntR family transcriptional regulator [Cyclobacterium xiamenense]SEJ18159.1 substrate-binding protein-like domain-containing protein [Cyclobacterium xiamenense]